MKEGAAVAIVLMFLGVLSLVGAGLILQTRLDVQFTRASESASSMIALADGASSKAVKNMPANPPMEASGADPIASEVTETKVVQGSGQYQYRHVYVAKAPSGAIKGFEVRRGRLRRWRVLSGALAYGRLRVATLPSGQEETGPHSDSASPQRVKAPHTGLAGPGGQEVLSSKERAVNKQGRINPNR